MEVLMKRTMIGLSAVLVMLICASTAVVAQDLEIVKVRFTPRSLNLGSNGRWISCQISDLPEGYTPADVDPDSICIVAVNGVLLEDNGAPICSKDSGGPYKSNNPIRLKVKFDRRALSDAIVQTSGEGDDNATIEVAGSTIEDGVQFYGDDTIKIKAAKVKKEKK
jgi:hypothetical protein